VGSRVFLPDAVQGKHEYKHEYEWMNGNSSYPARAFAVLAEASRIAVSSFPSRTRNSSFGLRERPANGESQQPSSDVVAFHSLSQFVLVFVLS